jgi:hypothetical protein
MALAVRSPLSSAVDVIIEIVDDIYAISNSGPPREAYRHTDIAAAGIEEPNRARATDRCLFCIRLLSTN